MKIIKHYNDSHIQYFLLDHCFFSTVLSVNLLLLKKSIFTFVRKQIKINFLKLTTYFLINFQKDKIITQNFYLYQIISSFYIIKIFNSLKKRNKVVGHYVFTRISSHIFIYRSFSYMYKTKLHIYLLKKQNILSYQSNVRTYFPITHYTIQATSCDPLLFYL